MQNLIGELEEMTNELNKLVKMLIKQNALFKKKRMK